MIRLIFTVLQGSTLSGWCVVQLCSFCDQRNSGSSKQWSLVYIAQDLAMEASSHSPSMKLLCCFSCISHVEKENRKRYEESPRLTVLETEINTAS